MIVGDIEDDANKVIHEFEEKGINIKMITGNSIDIITYTYNIYIYIYIYISTNR